MGGVRERGPNPFTTNEGNLVITDKQSCYLKINIFTYSKTSNYHYDNRGPKKYCFFLVNLTESSVSFTTTGNEFGHSISTETYPSSAPDNMRICVKYACKNSKYSLTESLRSNITHKKTIKIPRQNDTIVLFCTWALSRTMWPECKKKMINEAFMLLYEKYSLVYFFIIFHSSSPISMSEILLKPKNYLELFPSHLYFFNLGYIQ